MTKRTKPEFLLNTIKGIGIQVAEQAELAIAHASFFDRAHQILSRFPVDGKRASRIEATSFFEDARQLMTEAKHLGDYLTSDRAKKDYGVSFDFGTTTYEAFEKEAHELASKMGKSSKTVLREHTLKLALHKQIGDECLLHNPSQDPLTASGAAKWFSKILTAIGIKDVWEVVLEILEENWPTMLERLGVLIAEKNWRGVTAMLGSLLNILCSKPFAKALAAKVGEKEAAKIIGKIAAKSVPFIGWAYLIGCLVWAFAEEYI